VPAASGPSCQCHQSRDREQHGGQDEPPLQVPRPLEPADAPVGALAALAEHRQEGEGDDERQDRRDAQDVRRDAIGRRVERPQDEVVQDDRADEPGDDAPRVRDPGDLGEGVAGQGEEHEVPGEVQRPAAVARPHANVSLSTHFVLCTPGSAGTMIRAG
jgi:hypothetical protein